MNSEELELLKIIATDMQELKSDVQELKGDVKSIDKRLTNVENTVEKMDVRLTNVELKIENEVIKGIKILAEGHGAMSKKLNNMHDDLEEVKESVSILNFLQKQMIKNK